MNNISLIKTVLFAFIAFGLWGCSKPQKQGVIIYQVDYQLPDSLKRFADFLPKNATVYFKGDSTVSIQQMKGEATTVIIDSKTNFMRVLLTSPAKHYVVNYNAAEQKEELGKLPPYSITRKNETKMIAGYHATGYIFTDKLTLDTTEAWFTKAISIPANYLTITQDSALGVPLSFSVNQNGIKIKTTVKTIRFEPVPAGTFSSPSNYIKLTPQQLREMPASQ